MWNKIRIKRGKIEARPFFSELKASVFLNAPLMFFFLEKKWICLLQLSKHIVNTHLVSPPSSWHSNQSLKKCHQSWTPGWQCCSCFWWQVARRSQYSRLRSQCQKCRRGLSHSSSPSKLSRRRPWLSGGRRNRWNNSQFWKQWILRRWSAPPPLGSSQSSQGC